jgi:hypothetical protein
MMKNSIPKDYFDICWSNYRYTAVLLSENNDVYIENNHRYI